MHPMRDRAHDAHLGVEGTTQATLNWGALENTRRSVLETRGQMALKTDTGVKIKVIQGFAFFESDHRLFVDTSGNNSNPHARAPDGTSAFTGFISSSGMLLARNIESATLPSSHREAPRPCVDIAIRSLPMAEA